MEGAWALPGRLGSGSMGSASDAQPGLRRCGGPVGVVLRMSSNAVSRSPDFILYVQGGSGGLKIRLFTFLLLPNVWLGAWLISECLIKAGSLKS